MYVRDILKAKGAELFTIGPEEPVTALLKVLVECRIGAAVVAEEGRLVGVVSERDVIRAAAQRGADCLHASVRELMTADVISCAPDTSIDDVMNLMTTHRIRHLPVLEGGELAGVVSIGDAVKSRIESAQREADQLREYIQA